MENQNIGNDAKQWLAGNKDKREIVFQALKRLEDEWKEIPDCSIKENYEEVRKGIRGIVRLRVGLDNMRKEQGQELRDQLEKLNNNAKEVISRVEVVEAKLKAEKKKEDDRQEQIKIEKAKKELERVSKIEKMIAEIRSYDQDNEQSSVDLEIILEALKMIPIEEKDFQELTESAQKAKDETLIRIENKIHRAKERERIAAEQAAEQARLEAERLELQKQAEALEAERRKQQAEIEALRAEKEAAQREIERQKQEAENQKRKAELAEQERVQKEEQERARLEAEKQARLEAERLEKEKIEREKKEAAQRAEEEKRKIKLVETAKKQTVDAIKAIDKKDLLDAILEGSIPHVYFKIDLDIAGGAL